MGICYSEEEEWGNENYRRRRKNKRKNNHHSIIYEERTICESSFASKVEGSFREDIHHTLYNLSSETASIHIGSIVEMGEKEMDALYTSLTLISPDGQTFNPDELFTLCNLKTKNFLHTHKIQHPDYCKLNQVSACPYNSNHILQYDLWKLIPVQDDRYCLFHPFTQRYLGTKGNAVVCQPDQQEWKIVDFGERRNGGFMKIIALNKDKEEVGQLCMTDSQGLLPNHRKLAICTCNHVSHLWELNFGQCILE